MIGIDKKCMRRLKLNLNILYYIYKTHLAQFSSRITNTVILISHTNKTLKIVTVIEKQTFIFFWLVFFT